MISQTDQFIRPILITNFLKIKKKKTKNGDDEEINVEIIQKEIRIVMEKYKRTVRKYDDNDTFQLFQRVQVQCTYIIIMYLILP